MLLGLEREVLLAPDLVARAAARMSEEPVTHWMLCQPAAVRRSYVKQVMDRGGGEQEQKVWMLRQADSVRQSYVRDVLGRAAGPPRAEVLWMLSQPDAVRESYIIQVLERRS